MHRIIKLLLVAWFGFAGPQALAAHTRVSLLLESRVAPPGATVWAAVRLEMDEGWHTYWRNAGEGGLGVPTKVTWQLPPGITNGSIFWPVPEKVYADEATTYVLHDEAALLVPLQLAADLKPGTYDLDADVRWMECKAACVPGKGRVTAKLEVGTQSSPSESATLFPAWRLRLPKTASQLDFKASWEGKATGDKRPLIIDGSGVATGETADFLPDAADNFDFSGKTEDLGTSAGNIRLRKSVLKFEGDWPKEISGLLTLRRGDKLSAFEVKIPIRAQTRGDATAEQSMATGNSSSVVAESAKPTLEAPTKTPFSQMLRYLLAAFVGGLLLNIMPCVFPVIALKILGFVQHGREEPRRVLALGLIYGLGVLVSFLVMAGLVIAIKQAGGVASWGMQFKSPQLSVGFIALVLLIALNLFGVFEVNFGGSTLDTAGQLAAKNGAAGAFFNGVLATVLATPCTAPILATALGFAFSQPALIVLLFFLAIGIGLALPYVLLSWRPGWLKFLPQPGEWMEKFKTAMGFPMVATAIWILWFTAPRFGEDGVIWIGFFMIGLAFAVWIWGSFVQRGGKRRGVAMVIAGLVVASSYVWALEINLGWRSPVKTASPGALENRPQGVPWQPWSTEALDAARRAGRPVLVDFTAKWCLTCNKFVKPAVDNAEVRAKLEAINGVALLADNTDYPDTVMQELRKYHADAAVPLVLVYSRDASREPQVLPTIPTRQDVLEALDKAAR